MKRQAATGGAHRRTDIDMKAALRGIVYEKNVSIPTRDGSYVSANVFRPEGAELVPALLCVSSYGKDLHTQDAYPDIWDDMGEKLPHLGDHSTLSLHTHETNDPEIWVPWGYACLRVDLPGVGKSPGKIDPLSPAEAQATYDAIEWAAAQPWSNGKVGMSGISYLAMIQWRVATEKPPHLTCICPWEGLADFYRDWNRHGGIVNTYLPAWMGMQVLPLQHGKEDSPFHDLDDGAPIGGPAPIPEEELDAGHIDPIEELRARELDESWWRDRSIEYERVTVPMLSAGNWGGQGLHLRGNTESFSLCASTEKWLEIHGGNHRDEFYLPHGEQLQKDFFDYYLRGIDNGWPERPRVMLRIRHVDDTFTDRDENEWPLARTRWTKLYLDAGEARLTETPPEMESEASYRALDRGVAFRLPPFERDTEITGPLAAVLRVSSSTEDMDIFATVRLLRPDGSEATFYGSADPASPLTQGWLRVSHRKLDPARSTPWRPWHTHDELQKLTPGEVYEVQVEIWPTCVIAPAGHQLELLIEGHDFVRPLDQREPLYAGLGERFTRLASDGNDRSGLFRGSGLFLHNDSKDRPASVFDGTNTLHTGGPNASYLLVPVIPTA